jgi:hypothetical protein
MNQAAWKHFSHPGASFLPEIACTNPALLVLAYKREYVEVGLRKEGQIESVQPRNARQLSPKVNQ